MNRDADAAWLATELAGSRWREFEWVAATGSTNADLSAAWRAGAPDGRVLLADFQSAGRGRFDRAWVAPPGAMVALSVLVRPDCDDLSRWAWLPLVTGLAVAEALRETAGVPAAVKWPNDVLVGGKKICGILTERVLGPGGAAVVIGIGVNTAMTPEQAPVEQATSLAMEGCSSSQPRQGSDPVLGGGDREPVQRGAARGAAQGGRGAGDHQEDAPIDPRSLVVAVLRRLDAWYARWAAGEDLVAAYSAGCATVARDVRVLVTPDDAVEGRAVGVDADGLLLVDTPYGRRSFAAGDVWHLRSR